MRNILFGFIATLGVSAAVPVLAQSAEKGSVTVVREGDATMTCSQMADEAAELSASMGEEGGGGLLGMLGGVARAGAAMIVPGAGLALAGADAVTASGRERRETKADAGRDRWNYLNGLYAGKRCNEAGSAAAVAAQTTPSPSGTHAAPTPTPTPTSTSTAPVGPAAPRIQTSAWPT